MTAQQNRKHPFIFRIEDLINDPTEWERLEEYVETIKNPKSDYKFDFKYLLIQSLDKDSVVDADDIQEIFSRLRTYNGFKVVVSNRHELKTMLYVHAYSNYDIETTRKFMDSFKDEVNEAVVEIKSKAVLLGACPTIGKHITKKDLTSWVASPIEIGNSNTPDWKQSKLKKGKGHNKFKRK